MKTVLAIGMGIALIFFGNVDVYAQSSFKRAKSAKPEPVPVAVKPADFQTPLKKALELHNFLNKIPFYQRDQKQLKEAKEQTVRDRQRYAAMEACNIARLEAYFKDPKKVWQKMKDKYDVDEKDLAIYFNSSAVLSPQERAGLLSQTNRLSTDQELSEMFMYWSLGKTILDDVYQNPEKWGEVKKPNTAVFPLWSDQKYLVDRSYDQKYTEINTFFGVPPTARPLIGDAKYDYKQHNEVVLAHTAYISSLSAAKPERALLMPDRMKQPPAAAPVPLPPAQETVVYIKNQDGSTAFFPETPAPWKTFSESGFVAYNPSGEMARDFTGKSFQVRPEVGSRDPSSLNHNRLEVYQLLKKQLDSSEKSEEISQRQNDTNQKIIQLTTSRYGINVEKDEKGQVDLLNQKWLDVLTKSIQDKKQEYLKQSMAALIENERKGLVLKMPSAESAAKEEYINQKIKDDKTKQEIYQQIKEIISVTPEEQARHLIHAMQTDIHGDVFLTRVNAKDIEGQIKEAQAVQALRKESDKRTEEYLKKYQKPKKIDEMCLNGGEIF